MAVTDEGRGSEQARARRGCAARLRPGRKRQAEEALGGGTVRTVAERTHAFKRVDVVDQCRVHARDEPVRHAARRGRRLRG